MMLKLVNQEMEIYTFDGWHLFYLDADYQGVTVRNANKDVVYTRTQRSVAKGENTPEETKEFYEISNCMDALHNALTRTVSRAVKKE